MLSYVLGDSSNVRIVESGVYFVEDEKGTRLVRVDCEEEGEGGHCFFAAGQVLHVSEAFERRHGVVFQPGEVGLVGVFYVQIAMGRR